MTTKPSEVVKVGGAGEIQEGKTKVVKVGSATIAVFRVKDEYFAIDNTCLHRGGPLGQGEVYEYTVTCPWHGWTYDIKSGSFDLIPPLKVKTYPVKVSDGDVFVEIG